MKKYIFALALLGCAISLDAGNVHDELQLYSEEEQHDFILSLYEIGAIKTGLFTLSSGLTSSLYVDLRCLISHPLLLQQAALEMSDTVRDCCKADRLCAVPYGAVPLAVAMLISDGIPMVSLRKETKQYGTRRRVEGNYEEGQTCLVIEDVMTTGASILRAAKMLEEEGFVVNDVVILVDREQGGRQLLERAGYHVHAVYTISELLGTLSEIGVKFDPIM